MLNIISVLYAVEKSFLSRQVLAPYHLCGSHSPASKVLIVLLQNYIRLLNILILSYFVRDFGFWINIFIKLILFITALVSLKSSLFFQKEINLILKKYKVNF